MPYSKEQEKEYIERIRSLVVVKPRISILEIQRVLQQSREAPLHLDKNYIGRLLRKARGSVAEEISRITAKKLLSEFGSETSAIKEKLWAIVLDPKTTTMEKLIALRELRSSGAVFIEKMIEAGLLNQGEPPPEGFINFQLWGQLRPRTKQLLELEKKNEENQPTS